ncbi:MAG TPA: M28 family peptidase [Planctomycetaceae bacterium]|nr:M28 family peptidase [Planctomycetaceae bacterium]
MKPNLPEPLRSLTIALLGLFVIELLVCGLYRGPRPIPDEPVNEQLPAHDFQDFSAERAVSIHEELFPPKPHPAGSVENLLVRDRLAELLRHRGWQVEIQTAIVESDVKVVLHNVLAHHSQLDSFKTRPLVLATHYDSCRTGPGAGDAGGCVAAVIEAARALFWTDTNFRPDLQRPVYLLFTDGEELGLLGAQQFVKRHPLSARKPIVLNFDARGTSGPVVMYETHAGNRAAIAAWSNELARPRITGSLFTAVYRTMPNGSDFTVFQRAGWQGFNFAIIDGAHRYHMPDDTLANLDRRSLQHFGEHALNLARRIATTDSDLPQTPDDAVYFDVLGLVVWHYPLSWSLPLSIAAFVLICGANRKSLLVRDGFRVFVRVGIVSLVVASTSAAVGWFLSRLLRDVGLLPRSFVWYGHGLSAALWLVSAAISLGITRWQLRRCPAETVWSVLWLWWTLAGISVTVFAPQFSHLLIPPALLAVTLSMTRWSVPTKMVLATSGSAVLHVPVLHLLSIALGPSAGALLCPAFALALLPLYPALACSTVESTLDSALTPAR